MSGRIEEKIIFEIDKSGREGYSLPKPDVEEVDPETVLKDLCRKGEIRPIRWSYMTPFAPF